MTRQAFLCPMQETSIIRVVELPVPTINVTHIKFDHEAGEDSDAVDIREDYNHDIPIPE